MCASAPVQPSRASRRRSCSTKRHLERSTDGRERSNLRKRADGSHRVRVAVNGAAAQTLCARLTTDCGTSAASLSSCAMRRMRRSSWFSRRPGHALPNLRHHASSSGVLLPRALATHAARRRLSQKPLAGARGARRARALASWNSRDPSRWRRMRHRAASAPARLEAWSEPGGRKKIKVQRSPRAARSQPRTWCRRPEMRFCARPAASVSGGWPKSSYFRTCLRFARYSEHMCPFKFMV